MSEQINIRTEILLMLNKHPFAPFTILMSSGDRYEVADPHAAAVGETAVIVVPPRGAGHSVLRLNRVCSMDALEPA